MLGVRLLSRGGGRKIASAYMEETIHGSRRPKLPIPCDAVNCRFHWKTRDAGIKTNCGDYLLGSFNTPLIPQFVLISRRKLFFGRP